MTIEEFDKELPYLAMLLRGFTGHAKGETRIGTYLNRNRRMDITGVYQNDGGGWFATVDHLVGDVIETELCYWLGHKWSWHESIEADRFASIGE